MELYNIGKHCARPECHQLDYLPFYCRTCSSHYCLAHRQYEHHINCAGRTDVKLSDEEIIKRSNVTTITTERPKPKHPLCGHAGCKARPSNAVAVICRQCAGRYCVRHRFHEDHSIAMTVPARTAVAAHWDPWPKEFWSCWGDDLEYQQTLIYLISFIWGRF